ncbi:F-box-like domain superfamily [Sesbania bispinosa]|nr:F-box-like domain superfamily [Sesbania bispinosa]
MNNLWDDLLTEIWCRVPYKIVVSCKSISKRFLALFSSPDFIKRSIYHSHTLLQHMNDEEREKEWYLNFVSEYKLLILFLPNIHLSNPQNQLSCDRKFNDALEKRVVLYPWIVCCSNGLLLCRTCGGPVYHVCNPVTTDKVLLPPLPPPYNNQSNTFEGFICEPHYEVEGNNNKVTLNLNGHRFRVVRIGKSMNENNESRVRYEMVVFSSETGQWSEKLVSCPKGKILQPGVAHGGKIYFRRREDVVVYDPFNNDEECHIINFPKGFWSWDLFGHIGCVVVTFE